MIALEFLLTMVKVLNACWVPIIYFTYPETKGLALEDVDRLFAKTEEAVRRMSAVINDEKLAQPASEHENRSFTVSAKV